MRPERFDLDPTDNLTVDTVPMDLRELHALLGDGPAATPGV